MLKDKGFTLIELLISFVIFSLITSLILFSFTQLTSIWERTDKEIEKLDHVVFLNDWIKELFHSVENISLVYRNKSIPIFFGREDRVIFVSSDPLMKKIISLIKLEIKNGSIFYSEEILYQKETSFENLIPSVFENDYKLLSNIEGGKFYYLKSVSGNEEWDEEFDSEKLLLIPRAVKIEFFYEGKKVEIISSILSDPKPKELLMRGIF